MGIADLQAAAEAAEARLGAVALRCAEALSGASGRPDPDHLRHELQEGQWLAAQLDDLHRRCVQAPGEDGAARMAAQVYFMGLAERRQGWQRAAATREIAARRRVPLYPDRGAEPATRQDQTRTMDATLLAFHRLVNPAAQDTGAEDYGCHADVPLRPSDFAAHTHAAARVAIAQGRARPLRFLDVGCGSGVNVLMAAGLFEACDGLEYDPGYAAAARRMFGVLGTPGCRILEGDALTFDGYGAYDVIYFFRPMRDEEMLIRLEERILEAARPGTILIAPYLQFASRERRRPCAQVAGGIFVAGLDAEAADALNAAAERVGTAISEAQRPVEAGAGYLTPMIAAWRAFGYSV